MKKGKSGNKFHLKGVLTWERNICRAIASWSLYALLILLTTEGDFFDLSFAQDKSLGSMVVLIALIFAALTIVAALLRDYETDSWFLLTGATGCVLRWVSTFENDIIYKVPIGSGTMQMNSDETLFLLAVIFAYMLFLLYFLQKNDLLIDKLKIHSGVVLGIIFALGIISATVIAVTTCMRYLTFTSPNFDFGLFVNMFHNMTETGLPLISSERDVLLSHFVVHLSPIYYVLLPVYALFPSAMTLQISQAVLVVSGIIPTILIARHYKLSNGTQIVIALIYAMFPAISMGCFYDFHENCFLLPLLLWVFYFFEKEKYLWMYGFAFLTLMVKEDAAIYVILFALYVILSRKKFLHGTILALASAAYFLLALAILEGLATYWADFYANDTPRPSIEGPMINRFDNLIYDKDKGLLGAILTALKNPGYLLTQFFSTQYFNGKIMDGVPQAMDSFFSERSPWAKFVYFLHILLPVGMIPFCTKKQSRWLLLAPILLNVLSTYKYQYNINFQYHFAITAFIMYAMIINLPDIQPIPRRRLLALGVVASCCMYIFLVIPKYNQYTDQWEKNKETYKYREEMLDTIPEGASLCVPGNYLAHCADRREVYDHSYHIMKDEKIHLKEKDVDYAVMRNGTDDKYRKIFEEFGYTVWAEFDGHVILKSPHVD